MDVGCTCQVFLLIQIKANRRQLARIPSDARKDRQTYRLSETTRSTGSTVVWSAGFFPPDNQMPTSIGTKVGNNALGPILDQK